MKIKERLKRKYYILISLILVFFFTCFFINFYNKKVALKLDSYANQLVKEELQKKIIKNINNVYSNSLNDLLIMHLNSNNEILFIDYNLKKSYEILNKYVNNLSSDIKQSNIIIIPFFAANDSLLFANLGPKIRIKYDFINSVIANIHTKVTNYGINNALLEIYLHLEINYLITIPINTQKYKEEYDLLLTSKVVSGKVPSIYGTNITKDSSIVTNWFS